MKTARKRILKKGKVFMAESHKNVIFASAIYEAIYL